MGPWEQKEFFESVYPKWSYCTQDQVIRAHTKTNIFYPTLQNILVHTVLGTRQWHCSSCRSVGIRVQYVLTKLVHQPPLVKELGWTLIALHALLEKFWWKSLNVTDDAILESSTVYDVKFSRIEGDTWSKNRHIKLSNSVIS